MFSVKKRWRRQIERQPPSAEKERTRAEGKGKKNRISSAFRKIKGKGVLKEKEDGG